MGYKICVVKNNGFSLLEIVVSLSLFSMILLVVFSSFYSMNVANLKTTASREASENAKKVLEEIIYEIRSAKGVYTPTTTASQLSLETSRYIPVGEDSTYIDFFLCEVPSGSAICLKKESQNPIILTSDLVNVTSLTFSQISTSANPSVQVSLTVNYLNQGASGGGTSSTSLTSTASLRNN